MGEAGLRGRPLVWYLRCSNLSDLATPPCPRPVVGSQSSRLSGCHSRQYIRLSPKNMRTTKFGFGVQLIHKSYNATKI
eukprot:1597885-Amphidinium_carterae.1